MLFRNIGIVDENFAYREGMYVGTVDDRIAYIGTEEPAADNAETKEARWRHWVDQRACSCAICMRLARPRIADVVAGAYCGVGCR